MLDVHVKGDMVNRFYILLRDKRVINQNCSTYIIDSCIIFPEKVQIVLEWNLKTLLVKQGGII